jgi:hypothetical protein
MPATIRIMGHNYSFFEATKPSCVKPMRITLLKSVSQETKQRGSKDTFLGNIVGRGSTSFDCRRGSRRGG